MEEARTKIAELKHACATLDEQLAVEYRQFGQAVYENTYRDDSQPMIDARTCVAEKKAAVDEIQKNIHHIEQATSASETAREEITKIEQRLASIEYEKNSLYSRIGVITYEEYAAGAIGEEFSLLFTSITHQNAELSRYQKELKENELRYVAASFFEKMSLKMKRNKLKAEMEKMDSAREDLFRNAGKQICNSELIKRVKSRNAAVISEDFSRLDQERDRMYALLESRKIDLNRNQDVLSQSGIETPDVVKKVRELGRRLDKAQQLLDQEYAVLGKAALGDEGYVEELQSHEDVAKVLSEIDRLNGERREIEHQLNRLESALRIRELESAIDVDRQKEVRIKGQLDALKGQLEELDHRITANRKHIASLKQVLLDDEPADRGTPGEQS
ncbi:MAG: hypothetical protein K9M84_06145 [Spirochaetia bacterium]|nr:hypothetical protein [Spirochaetia bacterium]MCF7941171.1 hypothetical protein [Spirochaetia bacterium]